MAIKTLILGNSGTGKSASMRNFKEYEICVISCAGKPLPFRNNFDVVKPTFENLSQDVMDAIVKTDKKIIVVDDAQYIMSFQYMRRIHENGWDKWNDIQGDFFQIIQSVDLLPDDVTVYFLSHTQRDDEGHEKIKTMGKMLDEKITIEGLFTTVLKTSVQDGHYYFVTQNNGMDTVKSPIGMFDTYAIDNDLKYVDEKIRNYYNFDGAKTDEEITKLDEQVEAPEVEKPEPKTRRRGRPKKSKLEEKVEEITATPKESKPATEEKPKRRRRKTRTADEAPLSIDDDTLPF